MGNRDFFIREINVLHGAGSRDDLLSGPFAGSTHHLVLMNLSLEAGRKHNGDCTKYNGLK